jgi:hypothetical protein
VLWLCFRFACTFAALLVSVLAVFVGRWWVTEMGPLEITNWTVETAGEENSSRTVQGNDGSEELEAICTADAQPNRSDPPLHAIHALLLFAKRIMDTFVSDTLSSAPLPVSGRRGFFLLRRRMGFGWLGLTTQPDRSIRRD